VKNKKSKRLGRGAGSGKGKTSGRGHKGKGQRTGKKSPYCGFRGGNLSYIRRLPKRGFNPCRKKEYQIVNLKDIQRRIEKQKDIIDPNALKEANLIKNDMKPVKILGEARLPFKIKALFKAHKFSSKAKKIIEDSGGKIECLAA
jgi:large subunit ribosomal protein L15